MNKVPIIVEIEDPPQTIMCEAILSFLRKASILLIGVGKRRFCTFLRDSSELILRKTS